METILEEYGVDDDVFPPAAVLVLMDGLARFLVMEEAIGLTTGHAEVHALVERFLARLEGAR